MIQFNYTYNEEVSYKLKDWVFLWKMIILSDKAYFDNNRLKIGDNFSEEVKIIVQGSDKLGFQKEEKRKS